MLKPFKFLFILIICLAALYSKANQPSKIITVRDGLPQSYVSGIYQDKNGFLWLGTLNGLGRYDGREFKRYQHTSSNPFGMASNIILHFFNAGNDKVWLCYLDGRIDLLNTISGKIEHLNFEALRPESGYFKSLVHSDKFCWMMSGKGGIYQIGQQTHTVKYLSLAALNINAPILGLSMQGNNLLILTQTRLFVFNQLTGAITQTRPYPFKSIAKFAHQLSMLYSPAVRPNGDLILIDAKGIEIWNPANNFYKLIPLTSAKTPSKHIATFDSNGNYFFEYNKGIYILRPNNTLATWSPATAEIKGIPTSICIDRSGVLWVGTNGFGLRQYNLSRTGLSGYQSRYSFPIDVLSVLGVQPTDVKHTFLGNSVPYANRMACYKDSIWIGDINRIRYDLKLALCVNKQITVKSFHNQNPSGKNELYAASFLAVSEHGNLWGLNKQAQLIKFDIRKFTFQLSPTISYDPTEQVNGLAIENDTAFYITTNKSLVKYNIRSRRTEKLTTYLPSKDLLYVSNDPDNKNILWIGTLSDGLIRFNKTNKTSQVFDTGTGLPNNTIYSILPGNDGSLWCSSNKGIFAFNSKTLTIRSYTSRDGLTDDEFNRYYYAQLPGGNLAFGGPLGYTVFNPVSLTTDAYNPQIALTDLNIINLPKTDAPLSAIKGLHLRYNQNFITATFAAMQFDAPEKLQYRYRLKDLDKNWIMLGNDNKVSYTSLPPGNYVLMLNATNTAGKWSSYIPQIRIIIAPPYWKTWWFYLGMVSAISLLIYLFLSTRIRSIQKVQAQKLQHEREAMELHAMALRARMNPHFIFNCLNSIKALIQQKDDTKAVRYLTTFATLIRKQLNNTGNEITLNDELETCRLYLQLEAMRFEDRIGYHFHFNDTETIRHTMVPPLILQPIVENAIVHGLLPSANGGMVNIKVYKEGLFVVCEVEDNGIGRAAAESNKMKSSRLHQSKGINLLQERLTMHNRLNQQVSSLETADLYDPDGKPSGTLVIIKFNMEV
jgi:ligand-binding sensor domain-containing protein